MAGETPAGDALVVAARGVDRFTLLGFLSSDCRHGAVFWDALRSPKANGLPDQVRAVVVTKGREAEVPTQVATLSRGALPVVMSTQAWLDYEIPGSPFFVLVDGDGRRIGEGTAANMRQVAGLVHRAMSDVRCSPASAHFLGGGRAPGTDARRAGHR